MHIEKPHSDSRETAVKAASILNDLFIDPNVEQIHLDTNYIYLQLVLEQQVIQ